mmetsp:Transcript_6134/g.14775  ORF Transcript_6134/g.14775 Transcript_6134/m.14775 type:complete len:403 (+) Transcript_6134:136-1344(+)
MSLQKLLVDVAAHRQGRSGAWTTALCGCDDGGKEHGILCGHASNKPVQHSSDEGVSCPRCVHNLLGLVGLALDNGIVLMRRVGQRRVFHLVLRVVLLPPHHLAALRPERRDDELGPPVLQQRRHALLGGPPLLEDLGVPRVGDDVVCEGKHLLDVGADLLDVQQHGDLGLVGHGGEVRGGEGVPAVEVEDGDAVQDIVGDLVGGQVLLDGRVDAGAGLGRGVDEDVGEGRVEPRLADAEAGVDAVAVELLADEVPVVVGPELGQERALDAQAAAGGQGVGGVAAAHDGEGRGADLGVGLGVGVDCGDEVNSSDAQPQQLLPLEVLGDGRGLRRLGHHGEGRRAGLRHHGATGSGGGEFGKHGGEGQSKVRRGEEQKGGVEPSLSNHFCQPPASATPAPLPFF